MLAAIDADVVLLQEIDVGVLRTGEVDQARRLGEGLGMQHAFAAALEWDGGDFGLAVLSRLPMSRAQRISLDSEGGYEPRIAFDVTVCAGSRLLRLVDVHADFVPEVNVRNLVELAELLGPLSSSPLVLGGDFNATPQTEGVTTMRAVTGAIDVLETRDPGATRNGERIDYLLANPELEAAIVEATRVETEASDHTPLWVDLALR